MSIKNSPCPNWENYFFNHIKTEFEASAGMNVDRHLEFHDDATPIGKATISLLVAYGYLHGWKMAPSTETTWEWTLWNFSSIGPSSA